MSDLKLAAALVGCGALASALIVGLTAVLLCSGTIKEISVERDGARYLVRTYAEALRAP